MEQKRCLINLFFAILFFKVAVDAIPPYLWYSTNSVENYVGNGCECETLQINGIWGTICPNLNYSHEEAAAFNAAIVSLGINNSVYRYNRQDNAATAAGWTGTSAEINFADFLFYSGHGTGFGPHLGCNATYDVTCYAIRFHGDGYLKWVQASACLWFCHPDYADGVGEYARWSGSFQGVHTVQGHRAITYEISNPQPLYNDFWVDWVNSGESIDEAWKSAQIEFIYTGGARSGLQPATMAANATYAGETWAAAGDDAAPTGASWLSWRTVGIPKYE
jgi:3',5'-cyclic AMP phosphodiesterase CpdA